MVILAQGVLFLARLRASQQGCNALVTDDPKSPAASPGVSRTQGQSNSHTHVVCFMLVSLGRESNKIERIHLS